jgi:hypothetical protein
VCILYMGKELVSHMRHRRKKSEMPFADALSAANKRLSRALKEREQAQKSLASLNAEIPNLQRTIAALKAQLNGKVVPIGPEQPVRPPAIAVTGEHRAETSAEIPPEIAATLPPDDLTGIGSVREDKFLPDVEGEELIPEK